MAITQQITALPTPPDRLDPSTFDTRADAFLGALPNMGAELNTFAGQVNQTVVSAVSKAGDTMTGPLVLPANAVNALEAVPKQQLDAAIAAIPSAASPRVNPVCFCDFLSPNSTANIANGVMFEGWWTGINYGSLVAAAGSNNHPGVLNFKGYTTANYPGPALLSYISGILLGGGEYIDMAFQVGTYGNLWFGFLDGGFASAPPTITDGAYITILGSTHTVTGVCHNNGVESVTATTYNLTANTWYRAAVSVNSTATGVTFSIYSEAGALLWSDTVTANIPTIPGRETGSGVITQATDTSGGTIMLLDYLYMTFNRALVR